MSKEKDVAVDFLEENNDLAMPYVKMMREIPTICRDHKISATARLVYDYITFNAIAKKGVSFRFEVKEIAQWLGKSTCRVYKSLRDLENAGLLKVRDHGHIVCDVPYLLEAETEAAKLGRENRQRKEAAAFNNEVRKHEQVLGRELSGSEKKRLQKIVDDREFK